MSQDPRSSLEEALRDCLSALMLTVTNVPADGSRPHWCRGLNGHHDATCSGMIHTQDMGRAVLSTVSVTDEGLDVPTLAEAIAAVDLNLEPDDPTRRSWRETPSQLEQASSIAAEYRRLSESRSPLSEPS